ncbi:ABC transporter substrate-binding protein [Streptomyces sp. NPDC051976]|uniref:ABC transporter substrate-binding protein n=1 Tax=Streptomyces sp. NPDC051976 TaxID=3154947 RepID=UPI00343F4274
MRRVSLRTASIALALTSALVTSACATTSDSASGGKSFTYWSMWTQTEPQAKVLQRSIDAFTAKTGIKVNVQWQGRKVLDKVGPALLAGNAPDLVDQTFDQMLPTLAATGQARDLTGVLGMDTGEHRKVSDVIPAKLRDILPAGKDGTPWMIPYEAITVSLFYNSTAIAGPAPKTFDDLLALCRQAKATGKACIGTDGDASWATTYWFDYLLNRNGGSLPALAADKSGAAWKNPVVLKTAHQIEQLVKGGYLIPGYDATKYPEQQNNWATGKSLFFLMGSWLPSETSTFAPQGFQYHSVNFPSTGDTAKDAVDVIPLGFAVPKKGKNAEAAEKFIAFFLQRSQISGISTTAGNITPRTDTQAPASLADAAQSLNQSQTRLPFDNLSPDYEDKVLNPVFTDLWFGKTDAAGFVTKMTSASADYWKAKG